jgi:putative toxin-antitoxin system antitoxin component (TIGR02293 family)
MNPMASPDLFRTISRKDSLHFWNDGSLDYQRVRDFTGLDAADLARITGLAKSSVRYDEKAPKEVREHLENVANICNLVFQFFQDDIKTKLWLQTPNPMLGNVSPRDMIRFGRYAKLLRFVTQAMEEGSVSGEAPTTSTAPA